MCVEFSRCKLLMNLVLCLLGLYSKLLQTCLARYSQGVSCTADSDTGCSGDMGGDLGGSAASPQQESPMENTIRAWGARGSTLKQLQWGAALYWYKLQELMLCSTCFHLPPVLCIRMRWSYTVMEISVFFGTFLSLGRNQMVLYCNIWAQKYG